MSDDARTAALKACADALAKIEAKDVRRYHGCSACNHFPHGVTHGPLHRDDCELALALHAACAALAEPVRTYEDGVRERHLRDVLTRSVTAIDAAVDAMLNGGFLSQPAYELSAVRGEVAGLLETPPVTACAECGEHPVGECEAAKLKGVREERARVVAAGTRLAESFRETPAYRAAEIARVPPHGVMAGIVEIFIETIQRGEHEK